ncbi:MAG: hypothetical protein KVP17_001420 [Porospora cf. gigantea B]|uniref:uncharacterized protein n=1 Tax=Porospora cf. gigantea B TaxID=2853592 RepID=UPI003571EDEA|nr:MAG: hypothetical protein KVP17_001420 [Porospora cf. gigantea B]
MDETVALPEPDTTLNLSDLSFYFAVLSLVPPLVVEPPKKCSPGWLDTLKSVHDHLDAYRKLVTNLQICEDTCTEELREGQECNCCNHRSRSRKLQTRLEIERGVSALGLDAQYAELLQLSRKDHGTSLHQCQVVVPGLWIGSYHTASSRIQLISRHITHIVCAAPLCGPPPFPRLYKYLVIPVEDKVTQNLKPWFKRASAFIRAALEEGGNVLVHCGAGISRAPSFCAAFLVSELMITSESALAIVRAARPHIKPNPAFVTQLHEFSKDLCEEACKGDEVVALDLTPSPLSRRNVCSMPDMANALPSTKGSRKPLPLQDRKAADFRPYEGGITFGEQGQMIYSQNKRLLTLRRTKSDSMLGGCVVRRESRGLSETFI